MTPEQARAAIELTKLADDNQAERRIKDMEAHLNASDRVIFQMQELFALHNPTTDALAQVVSRIAGEEADPT